MITVAVFWYCLIKNLNNSLTKVVQNCIEVNCMVENKLCILVLMKRLNWLRSLRDFFVANGFYVLQASDGFEMLDILYEKSSMIDIILLDVMME